jgi:hypothetical protein
MPIEFWVCQAGRRSRWVVRLDDRIYGHYLDREQATLDAIEAAKDAQTAGKEVEVWDRSTAARVF